LAKTQPDRQVASRYKPSSPTSTGLIHGHYRAAVQFNQYAPKDEIVQDRLSRNVDERGAVIEWYQLDARWQGSIIIDLLYLRPDARYNIISMERAIHYDDRGNHVVLIVAPGLAESWNVPHGNFCDILHEYRDASTFVP
jgi:hypothetical protein